MGVSLSDIPFDGATWITDRWLFHLGEPLNCALGETEFIDGVAMKPVSSNALKRWVVSHGRGMIGAMRVVGEPCELGDCSALKPTPAPVFVDVVPAAQELAPLDDEDTDMDTPRAKHKGKR